MFYSLSRPRGGFEEFRRLEDEMNELFGRWPWSAGIRSVARGTYPPINVGSTPEQVDVYLFAAGLDPDKLEITLQKNLLTVSGERKAPAEKGPNYYRKERYDGVFRRVITLPDDEWVVLCTSGNPLSSRTRRAMVRVAGPSGKVSVVVTPLALTSKEPS